MAFTKDGFKKWISSGAPGNDDYVLLANGGYHKITNWLQDLSSNTTNAVSIKVGGTTKTIAVSTMKTSLGLGARAYDSTSYLPLSGGKMTGQITKDGQSVAWVNGRSGAILRETSTDGYHTLWSLKTTNGSWDFGEYSTSGYYDIPLLTYITDTNFNAGTNSSTYQIKFPLDSGTVALTKNVPSSLKNPYALTIFGVSYDGSAAKTVDKTTFISTLEEGTSTVTDGTMFVTSYASNNGFADTNAVNTPYKRKASRLYDYIKAKTDTLYSASGHNHDSSYVTALGTNSFGQLTWTKNGSVNCIVVPYATKAAYDASGNPISSTYLPAQRIVNPSASSTEVGITPFNVLAYKSAGFPMYTDPEFAEGTNYVNVYNTNGGTDVTITRGTSTSFGLNDSGNASGYVLKIQTAGTNVTPGWGGFYQAINSRTNAVFVQIFRAKLPSGYYLQTASNSMGDNYSDKFITSNAGTGKWEWYGRIVHCGATGTFSMGGHIYVYSGTTPSASAPLVWYLSYCNCINLTLSSYDGLRSKYCDIANSAFNAGTAAKANCDVNGNAFTSAYFRLASNNTVSGSTTFNGGLTFNSAGGTELCLTDILNVDAGQDATNITPGKICLNSATLSASSRDEDDMTFEGIDVNQSYITNLKTPIVDSDAATKQYVDNHTAIKANSEIAYATSTSDTRGHWTVTIPGVTSLYDGLKIHVKLSTYWYGNGESYNTLNVNGLGAKMVWWRYNSRLTSHFDINAEVTLTYRSSGCGSYTISTTTGELTKGDVITSGWVADYSYYSTDIDNLRYYYARPYVAEQVFTYGLCAFDAGGRLLSIQTTGGSGTSHVATTTAFRPEDIVVVHGTYAAGAQIPEGQIRTNHYAYTNYNFNTQPTVASTIYLVGTLDSYSGLFQLDQTTNGYYLYVPCNAAITLNNYFSAGKFYIKVGVGYGNSSFFSLFAHNELYYFTGTYLKPVIAYAEFSSYASQAGDAERAGCDSNGNFIAGTYFNKNNYNEVTGSTLFTGTVTLNANLLLQGSDSMINGTGNAKIVMPDYRVATSSYSIAPKLTGTTKQGYAVLNLTDQASSSQSDVFVSGVRTPVGDTDAANKKYVDDSLGAYLPLTGGTLTGLLTTTSGSTHSGIKVGDTYISAIGRNLILQNNNSIRFGDEDSWNWDSWAGLKYVHSLSTIYLGIADGAQFSADASQSYGTLAFPGITTIDFADKTLDLGNTALLYSWCDEEYDRNQVELTFDTDDGNGTGTFRVKCGTVAGSIPVIEVESNYSNDSSIFEVLTSEGGTIKGPLSIVTGDGGVGNLSVGNKLTVSGTITSSSTITASGSMYAAHFYESSDIRLKNVEHYLEIPIEKLASLPIFDFTWKNENKQLNSGTSAQAVQQVLPNVVSGEESLTVDYGILGTITGISACRELVKHEDEIQELKAKVIELAEKLKKYESKL